MQIEIRLSMLLFSITMSFVHALDVFPWPANSDECIRHSRICCNCGFILFIMILMCLSAIQSIQTMQKETGHKIAQLLLVSFASGVGHY